MVVFLIGSIVLRKRQPLRPGSAIYGRALDIDPEPFQIIARRGGNVGLCQVKSLVSGKVEGKWYKSYELHILPPNQLYDEVMNPITEQYLIRKYFEKETEKFYQKI
jgi:hypothetical protein